MMPSAVLLSVLIGVAGCGCPNSSHVIRSGSISRAFINMAPISDSSDSICTSSVMLILILLIVVQSHRKKKEVEEEVDAIVRCNDDNSPTHTLPHLAE